MLVVHLSGSSQKTNHCQERLLKSYQFHGKRWEQGKRYNSHIERFGKFCCQSYTDPIQSSTEMGIESLNEYFSSARSTLPSIIKPVSNVPFGKPSLVCKLLKRVFNIRPALPRYVTIWDVTKGFTLSSQN